MLVFALLAVMFSTLLFVTSLDWMLQSANKTKTKLALDRSTHAASLFVDEREAAWGRLVWDEERGSAAFERFLRLNLRLTAQGEPLPASHLAATPKVHWLEFVAAPAYPAKVRRSVVSSGSTRNVDVTVYGPSVIAIVEVHQRVRGELEPILLSSVASVRFR